MRQDPTECLFQFICSSNNHISRIHGMVTRICAAYGTPLQPDQLLTAAFAAGRCSSKWCRTWESFEYVLTKQALPAAGCLYAGLTVTLLWPSACLACSHTLCQQRMSIVRENANLACGEAQGPCVQAWEAFLPSA